MNLNPSLKNALLFFAFGLLLGFFLSYLWSSLLIPEYKPPRDVVTPKELIKEVTTSDEFYAKKADSLHVIAEQLKADLSTSKVALNNEKERGREVAARVRALLNKSADNALISDPTEPTPCDSLQHIVPDLLSSMQRTDSLNNEVVLNYEWQLKNKDSSITLKEEVNADLRSSFMKSIESEKNLIQDNAALQKTRRQQGTKSKITSIAIFIFTGFASAYLLHH